MKSTATSTQALEIQYNNQRRVPEFPELMQDWVQRTQALRARTGARLDIAYGDGERERLDLYPAANEDAPLLVFIHGGYWQRGDKSTFGFVAAGPLAMGFQVAVLNYGLCPQQPFADIAPQVVNALTWMLTRGPDNGVHARSIYLCGHSAGGHLTASMVTTDFSTQHPELAPCPLSGALAISGVFELEPLVPTTINDALGLDADLARSHSPALRQPVPGACALVAAVGGEESSEFLRQSRDLTTGWAAAAATRYLEVPGCNHFTVLEALADPRRELCQALGEMRADAAA